MNTSSPYPYREVEEALRQLLAEHGSNDYARHELAPLIAAKSLLMNHLYEDLGLASRKEMNALMQEHFPALAARKPENIRWKKYLYDLLGKTAPACGMCQDFDECFDCQIVQ